MANRFWVGGTGNWSDDTNHWATISGGLPGAGNKPTASDVAIFDTLSNTTAYTVTIDAAAVCLDLNFSAAPSVSGTITWAGSSGMTISGSMTLLSGMTRTFTGTILFNSTATGKTLASNSVVLASAITFNGALGGWTLNDALNNGSAALTLTNGTLNTNGQTVTIGAFSLGSGTKTLTLGASTINASGTWNANTNVANFTLNANTSTITFTGTTFSGGAKTYNTVNLNAAGTVTVNQANTFANLARNGTAVKTDILSLAADQTVSSTFTCAGQSLINRVLVQSSTLGTARTITAAIVTISNTDFQDTAGAGAGTWSGTSIGDALGNSGITFTTPVTRYWVAFSGGSWSATTSWSASDGGGSGASVPLCQDTVIINNNSITSGSRTITQDMPRMGLNITFSGVLNTPALATGNLIGWIFGNLTLGTITVTGTNGGFYFYGRGAQTLTSSSVSMQCAIGIFMVGGSLTLQDNLTQTMVNEGLTHNTGTFDANNKVVQISMYSSNVTNTRTLTMGTQNWTITNANTIWNVNITSLTLNANTSTIIISNATATNKTFAGGGGTYNNITFQGAGTGSLIITGANTFNVFTIDSSSAAKTVTFPASVDTVFTATPVWTGASGKVITINSSSSGTKHQLRKSNGTVTCDWLALTDSDAAGGASWVSGSNSTKSNTSGWDLTPTQPRFGFINHHNPGLV